MRSCNRGKRRICAKEEEVVSIVKGGEVCEFIEEQLRKGYIRPLKLPQNSTSVFCGKEGW